MNNQQKSYFEDRHFYKVNGCGVNYSIVPQSCFQRLFLTTDSGSSQEPADALEHLLRSVQTILQRENAMESVIDATVFLNDIGLKELLRQRFSDFFGTHYPAITYVNQMNCSGALFAIELHAISRQDETVDIQRHCEQAVLLKYNDLSVLYCADIIPERYSIGAYARSFSAFSNLNLLLSRENFDLTDVYRTWIHQGHIVAPEGDSQRYKELNRARTDFFADKRFLSPYLTLEFRGAAYPASTGIGADNYDIVMSAQAVSTERKDLIVTPLENPEQTSAFDYGEVYSPKSPKFARAMAFIDHSDSLIFVSGTASITDSETRHIGDPVKQTELTLDNIAALIAETNLHKHGIRGFSATLDQMATVRVYIKNGDDYPAIRECCERRLGMVPTIYTFADVCRPELLVEIEGIAVPKRDDRTDVNQEPET